MPRKQYEYKGDEVEIETTWIDATTGERLANCINIHTLTAVRNVPLDQLQEIVIIRG